MAASLLDEVCPVSVYGFSSLTGEHFKILLYLLYDNDNNNKDLFYSDIKL